MKEKHESRQRNPLKYVKLVSSNEGNGKKESGEKGNFCWKRKKRKWQFKKIAIDGPTTFRIIQGFGKYLGPFGVVIIEVLCLQAWD